MSRLLFPLAVAASAVSASALPPRTPAAAMAARDVGGGGGGSGRLSMPIVERQTYPGPAGLRRRDDAATLYNHTNVAYMIELGIGTPAQQVRVQLDTGSNELWVDPDCTTVSTSRGEAFCKTLGTYDPNKSSTYVDGEVYTTLQYGRGSAEIDYVSDNIVVPGTNNSVLEQVIFGVAVSSDDAAVPIMGVGFGKGLNTDYNNIVDELYEQGVTNGRVLSVALGSDSSDNGKQPVGDNIGNGLVIFGGVDTSKFAGPLVRFDNLGPQADDPGQPWRYWIQLDAVGFTKPGSKKSSTYSSSSLPIVLDTGSSLSYLPQNVVDDLASSFGVKPDSDGSLVVDCDYGSKGGSVDFTFGSLVVSVPLSDIIWEVTPGICGVGIMPVDGTTALFGDTFLRSVYVLFDQDNEDIYLAQAANCGSTEETLSGAGNYTLTGACAGAKSSAAGPGLVPLSGAALAVLVGVQALMALL